MRRFYCFEITGEAIRHTFRVRIYMKNKYDIWIIGTLLFTSVIFFIIAVFTIYIDPLFHYHAPLEKYEYPLNLYDTRYQNDGIARHFDYNGIITGSSMCQNFMVSEADDIFNIEFIKIPFSSATFKEIHDILERAYDAKEKRQIKYVIFSLDHYAWVADKDAKNELVNPFYLYNSNCFDDLNYILNKNILFERSWYVLDYTREGRKTTDFDDYANWSKGMVFGRDEVLSSYTLTERVEASALLTQSEIIPVLDNITANISDLADKHPETTFYLFFPPYSICYWDMLDNSGKLDWQIDMMKVVIEELLRHSNIQLYGFDSNFELTCNLDNYKDWGHYGEWVNSQILLWVYSGEYVLKQDNYQEYLALIRDFYTSYDYSLLRD